MEIVSVITEPKMVDAILRSLARGASKRRLTRPVAPDVVYDSLPATYLQLSGVKRTIPMAIGMKAAQHVS